MTDEPYLHTSNDAVLHQLLVNTLEQIKDPDLRDRISKRIEAIGVTSEFNPAYDPGDKRHCRCGHLYYRHFDGYEDWAAVGCKYCGCSTFVERSDPPTAEEMARHMYEQRHQEVPFDELTESDRFSQIATADAELKFEAAREVYLNDRSEANSEALKAAGRNRSGFGRL